MFNKNLIKGICLILVVLMVSVVAMVACTDKDAQKSADKANESVASVEQKVTDLEKKLADAETAIKAVETSAASNKTAAENAQKAIDDAKKVIEEVKTSIADLKKADTTANGKISTLETAVNDLQSDVDALETTVATLLYTEEVEARGAVEAKIEEYFNERDTYYVLLHAREDFPRFVIEDLDDAIKAIYNESRYGSTYKNVEQLTEAYNALFDAFVEDNKDNALFASAQLKALIEAVKADEKIDLADTEDVSDIKAILVDYNYSKLSTREMTKVAEMEAEASDICGKYDDFVKKTLVETVLAKMATFNNKIIVRSLEKEYFTIDEEFDAVVDRYFGDIANFVDYANTLNISNGAIVGKFCDAYARFIELEQSIAPGAAINARVKALVVGGYNHVNEAAYYAELRTIYSADATTGAVLACDVKTWADTYHIQLDTKAADYAKENDIIYYVDADNAEYNIDKAYYLWQTDVVKVAEAEMVKAYLNIGALIPESKDALDNAIEKLEALFDALGLKDAARVSKNIDSLEEVYVNKNFYNVQSIAERIINTDKHYDAIVAAIAQIKTEYAKLAVNGVLLKDVTGYEYKQLAADYYVVFSNNTSKKVTGSITNEAKFLEQKAILDGYHIPTSYYQAELDAYLEVKRVLAINAQLEACMAGITVKAERALIYKTYNEFVDNYASKLLTETTTYNATYFAGAKAAADASTWNTHNKDVINDYNGAV